VTLADASDCPVTKPQAKGPAGATAETFFGWGASYGNGKLWVGGLWPDGIIQATPDFIEKDGSIRMKFGWWRAVDGKLTITGHRVDALGVPALGDAPDGYGTLGFQASGVTFPEAGCWEVTGSLDTGTKLTFVTFVVPAPYR
jgi:hypothetical protein